MKRKMNSVVMFAATLLTSSLAFAQDGNTSWQGPAMAIALGLAALGGTLGQGKAVSAALDGIARNPSAQPKILTPMILGLAFIESLVIFALIYKFL